MTIRVEFPLLLFPNAQAPVASISIWPAESFCCVQRIHAHEVKPVQQTPCPDSMVRAYASPAFRPQSHWKPYPVYAMPKPQLRR
jgi:hypothetical protein